MLMERGFVYLVPERPTLVWREGVPQSVVRRRELPLLPGAPDGPELVIFSRHREPSSEPGEGGSGL